MICTPREEGWAAHLLSTLARYTLDSVLNSGDTMDCPILPGSSLKALLFTGAELKGPLAFDEAEYDVLLCIGITPAELKVCQTTGSAGVLEDLKARNIFPMTDIERR
jgi:hypothetical protein